MFQWNIFYIFHSVRDNKFLLSLLISLHIQELLVPVEIYKGKTCSSFTHHFISQCAYYWEKWIKITVVCYMAYFFGPTTFTGNLYVKRSTKIKSVNIHSKDPKFCQKNIHRQLNDNCITLQNFRQSRNT